MDRQQFLVLFLVFSVVLLTLIPAAKAETTVDLFDDQLGFWTAAANTGTAINYTQAPSGSLFYDVNTSGGNGNLYHDYGASGTSFTAYTNWIFNFWWYGNNSGATLALSFYNNGMTGYYGINWFDSMRGWQLLSFNMTEFQIGGSGMSWSAVRYIYFTSLDTNNTWGVDHLYFSLPAAEVTTQMISTDWLTFGGLVFLSILGVIFVLKSRNYLLNFIFGVVTFGAGAYFLGTDMILAGWINLLALLMGIICMTDAIVIWRNS